MNVQLSTHPSGVSLYTVRSGESEFEISAFGGQLLSWTKGGVPILFANRDHAIQDGKTPYRGGAPICFPYFSKGLLLPEGRLVEPQHGRARVTTWGVEDLVFRTEQPAAEGYGPATFRCELAYVFEEDLRIEAKISNIGPHAAPFQFVVHSYWASRDPAKVTVEGLGAAYLDNRDGLAARTDDEPSRPHTPPFDRVYPGSADRMTVTTEAYRLAIATQGAAGAVLWNPGLDHGIADLGVPDFVCVESGIVTPSRNLAPGEEARVQIAYRADLLR
ncbi:MAG: hypothetical protein ACO1SV_14085 [Fimbriimonas sp.]